MKTKQSTTSGFDEAAIAMIQLEPLLKKIIPLAYKKRLKSGSDLSQMIRSQKIKIPDLFQGDKITY